MAAKKDTKRHEFYWTPIRPSQFQTPQSRCNECGSRASHPVHTVNYVKDCPVCHGFYTCGPLTGGCAKQVKP